MLYISSSLRFKCALFSVCLWFGLVLSAPQAEAQWWKFWKKRGSEETVTQGKQVAEKPEGRNLKDVEKERKAAERALKKQQRKDLKEAEERREEVLRQSRESQKAIEKHQREILSQNKKNQRKLLRDIRSSNKTASGKRSTFLQRYRTRKSSSDSFFLSE